MHPNVSCSYMIGGWRQFMKIEKKSRNMVNCLLTTCLMSPAQVMKLKLSFIGQNGTQMVTLILCFTVHDIILWSIHVLNRFLQELDRRLLDTQKESKKHIPDRRELLERHMMKWLWLMKQWWRLCIMYQPATTHWKRTGKHSWKTNSDKWFSNTAKGDGQTREKSTGLWRHTGTFKLNSQWEMDYLCVDTALLYPRHSRMKHWKSCTMDTKDWCGAVKEINQQYGGKAYWLLLSRRVLSAPENANLVKNLWSQPHSQNTTGNK